MCGIAGIVSRNEVSQKVIETMTIAIAHRGPDSQGIYISDNNKVAFGHRRLSVIDLSPSANQPMTSGKYTVIFNGEIYNFRQLRAELEKIGYQFTTSSDTEVIIHAFDAWGKDSFDRLKGMFAIALYDRDSKKVFLARDPLGKKPLFVYRDNNQIAFASEIKSLLTLPGIDQSINKAALAQFLHLGYIQGPLTAWSRIEKFPSASHGEIDETLSLKISSFWKPTVNHVAPIDQNEKKVSDHFEDLLTKAVDARLVSDVPLGALLSGGTDSSLVCAIASRLLSRKLNTFTIGFEQSSFDESHYASQVAAALGTDHHLYMLKERDAVELVESYLRYFDEPFADSSAIPVMLLSEHSRKHVTVALTGDGGDELFLGYGAYVWAARAKKFRWMKSLLPASSSNSKIRKAASMFASVANDEVRSHIFSQEQGFFSAAEIVAMTGVSPGFVYSDPSFIEDSSEEEKQAFFDLNYYLIDDLLVKVDRGSMRYALECRCPLLDPSLVEYALQLQYRFKIRDGVSKYLLKKTLSKFLPPQLVYRKKWGFGIPLASWLRSDLRYLVETYLNPKVVDEIGFVKSSTVSDIVRRFNNGEEWLYHRVWALVCLHYWWLNQVR